MADDLDSFAKNYNAFRNAQFMMFAALVTDLAETKGVAGEEWLKSLRKRSIAELDAAKMQNPSLEFSPRTAEIAEMARSLIGATFDMADHRHKNRSQR